MTEMDSSFVVQRVERELGVAFLETETGKILFLDFFSPFETEFSAFPDLRQSHLTKSAAYFKYQIGTAHAVRIGARV
jgi:hypothetical protein